MRVRGKRRRQCAHHPPVGAATTTGGTKPLSVERFLYFAYGSNMSRRRLRITGRAPSAEFMGRAQVPFHRLTFDKVGVNDGSGKADCEYTQREEDVVLGGLYSIRETERLLLDSHGFDHLDVGYQAQQIVVESSIGKVLAWTYIAIQKDAGLLPFTWYIRHVVEGAKEVGLPDSYISMIARVPAARDPNPAREQAELAIYG